MRAAGCFVQQAQEEAHAFKLAYLSSEQHYDDTIVGRMKLPAACCSQCACSVTTVMLANKTKKIVCVLFLDT